MAAKTAKPTHQQPPKQPRPSRAVAVPGQLNPGQLQPDPTRNPKKRERPGQSALLFYAMNMWDRPPSSLRWPYAISRQVRLWAIQISSSWNQSHCRTNSLQDKFTARQIRKESSLSEKCTERKMHCLNDISKREGLAVPPPLLQDTILRYRNNAQSQESCYHEELHTESYDINRDEPE